MGLCPWHEQPATGSFTDRAKHVTAAAATVTITPGVTWMIAQRPVTIHRNNKNNTNEWMQEGVTLFFRGRGVVVVHVRKPYSVLGTHCVSENKKNPLSYPYLRSLSPPPPPSH